MMHMQQPDTNHTYDMLRVLGELDSVVGSVVQDVWSSESERSRGTMCYICTMCLLMGMYQYNCWWVCTFILWRSCTLLSWFRLLLLLPPSQMMKWKALHTLQRYMC